MPNVPLPDYDDFPKLAKVHDRLVRRVELYTDEKKIKIALKEINRPLFEKIRRVLPEHVKSFEFEGHQISPIQQSARRSFKRERLLNATFSCPECGEKITVPAKTLDRAYEVGKLPDPTVSVKKLGGKDGSGNENGDEE